MKVKGWFWAKLAAEGVTSVIFCPVELTSPKESDNEPVDGFFSWFEEVLTVG